MEGWNQFEGHSPHRPWVDAVKVSCTECGREVSRIKDVGNPWLDAGIVPFSTLGYRNDKDYWKEWFPADWISESFPGQFRNWFYSLLTMGAALENTESFRTVFSYALMRDEKGEDMHKSKGNAIWFDDAAEEMGVDAMRWLYARQNPTINLNFGYGTADEVRRRFLIPLWNVYSFFVTYANLDGYDPTTAPGTDLSSELDRWILSELNSLTRDVTSELNDYDSAAAARRMEEFVEQLSNWYVRRSRRRFWKSESDQDKLSAYGTLYVCLTTFIRLLAPFVPFLAEEMYQNLVRSVDSGAAESVHLTDFPVADESLIDAELSDAMRLVMRVSSLGRAARQKAQVRVRQPLERVLVAARGPGDAEALHGPLREQVLDELNVHDVVELGDADLADFLALQPNLTLLGPKLGERVGDVKAALQAASPEARVAALAGEQIEVGGFMLEPEEVKVVTTDVEGYAVAREGSCLVAIDTRLTDELRDEGLARELVHRIQNMRRSAEFDIADRIVTWYAGDERVASVMERHGDYVRQETLSLEMRQGEPETDAYVEEVTLDGVAVKLGVKRI